MDKKKLKPIPFNIRKRSKKAREEHKAWEIQRMRELKAERMKGVKTGRKKSNPPKKNRKITQVQKGGKINYYKYLRSKEWMSFRRQIFLLRGRKCEKCGAEKHLHVHHDTYENLGFEKYEDVTILCRDCHEEEHGIK